MSFFDWLWGALAVAPNPVVYLGGWLLAVGSVALVWLTIGRKGNVHMGPDPEPPPSEPPAVVTRVVATHTEFRYTVMDEWFPLQEFVDSVDAAADATVELAQVVESTDPLDATVELDAVDPSVPLFYTIRRPSPYVAETFTQGITRAQRERAKAARAEQ